MLAPFAITIMIFGHHGMMAIKAHCYSRNRRLGTHFRAGRSKCWRAVEEGNCSFEGCWSASATDLQTTHRLLPIPVASFLE
eukprot:3020482-Alexandrium_andersonii.AAC.1